MALRLHPSNSLEFNWSSTGKKSETVLKLENTSDSFVAFKVKTTQPKRYCVKPNSGCIDPKDTVEVIIAFQPGKDETLTGKAPDDKFLVQSMAVASKEATPDWSSSGSVQGQKLKCVFKRAPELESVKESPSASEKTAVVSPASYTSAQDGGRSTGGGKLDDESIASYERKIQSLTTERDNLRKGLSEATRAIHRTTSSDVDAKKEMVSNNAAPQSRVNLIWLLLVAFIAFFLGRTF